MKLLLAVFLLYTLAVDHVQVAGLDDKPVKHSISEHVIKGKLAAFKQFPSQALLLINRCTLENCKKSFYAGKNHTGCCISVSICGGSIISDRWILTAAHCIKENPVITVKLGIVHIKKSIVEMNSTKYIVHPKYNNSNFNNDVALVKLPHPVNFTTEYIQPINLPTRSMIHKNFTNEVATVAGFGRFGESVNSSRNLRYAKLRILSNKESQLYYENGEVIDSTICAMGQKDLTKISCSGDSGGPLILKVAGKLTLIGTVSFGTNDGCLDGFPDCFNRVTHYLDWIAKNTGITIKN